MTFRFFPHQNIQLSTLYTRKIYVNRSQFYLQIISSTHLNIQLSRKPVNDTNINRSTNYDRSASYVTLRLLVISYHLWILIRGISSGDTAEKGHSGAVILSVLISDPQKRKEME